MAIILFLMMDKSARRGYPVQVALILLKLDKY